MWDDSSIESKTLSTVIGNEIDEDGLYIDGNYCQRRTQRQRER
jgi:hypothetical protein